MELPVKTIIRILVTLALVALLIRLAPFLITFFIAILIAVTMSAAVDWLSSKHLPEWLSKFLVVISLVGSIVFSLVVLIPSVADQVTHLIERLPDLKSDLEHSILPNGVRKYIHPYLENPQKLTGDLTGKVTGILSLAFGGFYEVMLTVILAVYLMLGGKEAHDWVLAFFEFENQKKINRTTREIRPIIFGYVTGQAITSLIVAIYVFAGLKFLHVPAALTLATIAAICDIIPVIGFVLSLVSGLIMALTVSMEAALGVSVLYVTYMFLENYFIAPKVYGKSLKLSKLAVLLSILIGGELAGVPGMILALPIIASYPVIEKIWMRRYVGSDTILEHQQQGVE